nr:MAG TPA: hypothetical protein [Caudoviricetes sp.]
MATFGRLTAFLLYITQISSYAKLHEIEQQSKYSKL